MIKKKHLIIFLTVILAGIAADQVVKFITVKFLKPIVSYPLIEGVFNFTYRENTGAAFSMFEGGRIVFIILTSVLMAFLCFLICSGKVRTFSAGFALSLVISGGIGNLIDRVLNGYVVDMFDFCLINFAVFNVADMLVVCGCVLFIIVYFFSKGDVIVWKSK